MTPKRFEDFFGSIDFRDRSVVGDQVDQHAIDVATECRAMMERTAGWLTRNVNERQTETHNIMSEKMAARIAKDFGMVRCVECRRYDFDGVERCIHPGCGAPMIAYANNTPHRQEPAAGSQFGGSASLVKGDQ